MASSRVRSKCLPLFCEAKAVIPELGVKVLVGFGVNALAICSKICRRG